MKVNTTNGAEKDVRIASNLQIEQACGAISRQPVRLPLIKNGDEVVEVGYNGKMFLIRRGEQVNLPLPLLEILEHAGIV